MLDSFAMSSWFPGHSPSSKLIDFVINDVFFYLLFCSVSQSFDDSFLFLILLGSTFDKNIFMCDFLGCPW